MKNSIGRLCVNGNDPEKGKPSNGEKVGRKFWSNDFDLEQSGGMQHKRKGQP